MAQALRPLLESEDQLRFSQKETKGGLARISGMKRSIWLLTGYPTDPSHG
jgi:hypothetical protein